MVAAAKGAEQSNTSSRSQIGEKQLWLVQLDGSCISNSKLEVNWAKVS